MLILLFFVSIAAFALVSMAPLDPLQTNVGQAAMGSMSPEQIERLRLYWGEGIPPLKRYLAWAGDFIRGNMGISLLYHQPVAKVIQVRFASSVWLMAAAWILSGVTGVILGMTAGARKGSLTDRVISAYALVTASTPAFWVALVLLMVFAVWLKVLPVGLSVPIGADAATVSIADRIRHGILPAAALSLTGISNITLHTREKMIQVMESDYVLFARTRGESMSSIVLRHGLRNMILPALTLQFASISEIFGGSVLVEQVFSYPGLGQAAVSAGLGSDIPLLMGITMISAAMVFAGNFIADILYEIIDPRMRRGDKQQACAYDGAYGTGGISDRGSAGCRRLSEGTGTDYGFYQEKYSTLYTISFWNRLDGPGYVCAYPYRFVLKYTHWPDYICLQLPDRSGNGTCLRGRRKMGRQPDQWFY